MKVWKKRLSLLLVIQLLLAGGLGAWSYHQEADREKTTELLSFDPAEVTKLQLTEGDQSLELSLEDGEWTLPEHHSLPVVREKVQSLLEGLKGLRAGPPETTSASTHERLGLSEEKPNGRIKLYAGDTLTGELVLGEVPGFGSRYVRPGGREHAYRVSWQAFDSQASRRAWLDKGLLAVESPQEIVLPKVSLRLQNEKWVSGEEELDPAKTKRLVETVSKLAVVDLADDLKAADTTEVKVKDQSGKTFTYSFFKEEGKQYVTRDDREFVFQISPAVVKTLLETDPSELKTQKPEEVTRKN